MATSADFVNHVSELLAAAGNVITKRMFGGYGVYLDGLFVAIIVDDELYLKADDLTRAAFDAESCAAFVYSKDGKDMTMNYRRAPDEAMDAAHLMLPWARCALEAALRARAVKAAQAKLSAKTVPVKTIANGAPKKKLAAAVKPARPVGTKKGTK